MRSAPIATALTAALVGCAPGTAKSNADSARAAKAPADMVAEARAFMDAYGRDLLAGDRQAIAARYDRTDVYLLGNGRKDLMAYDSVVAQYDRTHGWSPPATFEWRDLSFEPVGPDAVVVAGRFLWGATAGASPMTFSYTGLLRRQGGVLRIRLEDESVDPSSLLGRPVRDTTRR